MSTFVHLHCHSDGSLLDGGNPVEKLVKRAAELGMPALAITDHGNMHTAYEFYEQAKKKGIVPILGMEAYVAPGHRSDKTLRFPPILRATSAIDGEAEPAAGTGRGPQGKHAAHLVLLARDLVGYKNLVKLTSIGWTEGLYRGNARIDREVLERYSEGLVVSSACLAGEVAQALQRNDWEEAKRVASWYANVFKDRYYLEAQAHHTGGQAELNEQIFRLADELGLPVVATNDAHFLTADAHKAHDALICIGMKKDRNDPKRLRYDEGLYFKSAEEMGGFFKSRPDALANTVKIAEECKLVFEKKYHVPSFPIEPARKQEVEAALAAAGGPAAVLPAKIRDDGSVDDAAKTQAALEIQLLRTLTLAGATKRYGDPLPEPIVERMQYELGVIETAGYAGYFLIVGDFIQAARDRGIPVGPGRGSAAGSLVAFALGITNLCPIKHNLLFERFLNPDRVSMPDVDVDFCEERRHEVIEYVRQKYGNDAVCQITAFGTMKSRAAIKDVGRILGFTPQETDAFAKLIPNAPNNALTIKEAIEKVADVRARYESDPRYTELCDLAMQLEGLRRHTTIHAAGVVIAPGPVQNYVPVATIKDEDPVTGEDRDVLVTQYDMNCLEKAGMLKMDFLGLTTLTVLRNAAHDAMARRPGLVLDLDTPEAIPLDDDAVYALFRSGKLGGVFQMESSLARDKMVKMRPTCFDDIVALSALLRPGPLDSGMTDKFIARKRGEEDVEFPHPLLAQTLAASQGIIVYQEQVMQCAQVLAGHTLAQADVLRKAVGKKDAELIKQELGKFVQMAVGKGTCTQLQAEQIASLIETFGRYGFNRSHSAAYGILTYQTGYLKAHYPAEFMAALLTAAKAAEDRIAYVAESRELGLTVLGPSVNESAARFTVVPGPNGKDAIRFGLGAIKDVGDGVVAAILAERAKGPFTDYFNFVERVGEGAGRLLTSKVLEKLIAAGALDGLGANRNQMLAAAGRALTAAKQSREEKATGQTSIFDILNEVAPESKPMAIALPPVPEMDAKERLEREKDAIGMYVTGHPLENVAAIARALSTHQAHQLREYVDGKVRLAGVVTQWTDGISKRSGNPYGKGVIEDLTGALQIMCTGEKYERFKLRLQPGQFVVIDGRLNENDREADKQTMWVDGVQPMMDAFAAGDVAVKLKLDAAAQADKTSMQRVAEILEQHRGQVPVVVSVQKDGQFVERASKNSVRPSPELLRQLADTIGAERIELTPREVEDDRYADRRSARGGGRAGAGSR